MPVLRITVDKIHQGTDKISLVDFPAMQIDWLKFRGIDVDKSEGLEVFNFEALASEQKLAGPFIIPNKPILREHPETKQRFWVIFPTEVVQEIADRFNENLNGAKFNKDHSDDVEGVYVTENWIIENPALDKAKYKFKHDLPAGTWYGVVKVKNTDLWTNEIVTDRLRGFSVEMIAGLSFSMNNAIIEETALSKLEGLGEKRGKNWVLIHSDEIDDNEGQLDNDQILGKYDFNIVAKPLESSNQDREKAGAGTWLVRYEYSGPKDSKNRNFCRKVLDYQQRTDKVFRKEDIDQMSFRSENKAFGTYSIFTYKGSFGCRHRWRRLIFFKPLDEETVRNVGNVPQVVRTLDDGTAVTDNPKPQPKKENFNNINMNTENQNLKLERLEDLAENLLVVGQEVDDENGEYTVNGVVYVVTDGKISEVKETAPEAPATEAPVMDEPDAWKIEVMQKLAELEAKLEELTLKVNEVAPANSEDFTAVVKSLFSELKGELTPAKKQNEVVELGLKLSTAELMAKKIAELQARKK